MASTADHLRPDIILNSPVGSKPAIYHWPLTYVSKGQKIDGAEEIIETIRWVAHEYLEFKPAIENLLTEQPNFKSYDSIKSLCDKYNKIPDYVMKMNKGTSVTLGTSSRASQGLLKHIIQQVYNFAVAEPNELNKYSPFSSETYGETSFEFMAQLIDRNQFRPKEQDVFIDLGSGVGHLVLQMAGSIECKKCYGIEIADVPAGYAKRMEERFKFWMNWHGKTYTDFELFHGDFFDGKYSDIIKSSTYILVNNFAFKPDVDHELKQRFLDLKDGTQILSSKPFCSPKNRVNERNLTDIGSIMHVVEIQPEQKKDTVSWTPKPLPYYLHVLDGSRIERYYERQKRKQGRTQTDRGKPSKRRKVSKTGSDSQSEDSDHTFYGTQTRRAYSDWRNSMNVNNNNNSNRASTDSSKTTSSSRNNSTDTENLYDSAIGEEPTAIKSKETDTQKRDKKPDIQASDDQSPSTPQETSAQAKNDTSDQAPKSCLDKKRDYAIKKSSNPNLIQNAPPSALYSISKTIEPVNGSTSSLKIPNIVIKVKPTLEAKVVSVTNTSNTKLASTLPKKDEKVTDENGKKLRQRKKPQAATSQDESSTTSASPPKSSTLKSEPKVEQASNSNSILGITPNGSRAKKAQPVGKNGKTSSTTKRKSSLLDKNSSLELLHAKTVESVAINANNCSLPAPGCEDHNLRSIIETPSLPKVVIKDLSMFKSTFLGPKNVEKFVETTKTAFANFFDKIQQPNVKEALMKTIEQERTKNRELRKAEEDLTRHLKVLEDRIPIAMKVHCDELGIMNNQTSMITHLATLLKKHQELSNHLQSLEILSQPTQRILNPPAAHSNSNQGLLSPYRAVSSNATLDLSLKQVS